MNRLLQKIHAGEHLTTDEMHDALRQMLAPETSRAMIENILMALHDKGETAGEIAAAAYFLRAHAQMIASPANAVDCCGTGGDVKGTYNISTAVALVCSACKVPMAKHGNRASTSKSGAADVLEALGVRLDLSAEHLGTALQEYHFAFLMAPQHHQVLKPLAQIRKDLATPTIFNLLGPLANPAGAKIQLLGVYDPKWLHPMAEALKILGAKRAWVVHGDDGLDEITLTTTTQIVSLEHDGAIRHFTLNPQDYGMTLCDPKDLTGGDATKNAAALRALLSGQKSAYRDITILNAAAVLLLSDTVISMEDGLKKAANAIDSGAAQDNLNHYIKFTEIHHE